VLGILTPLELVRPSERAATAAEGIRAHALYPGTRVLFIRSADAL